MSGPADFGTTWFGGPDGQESVFVSAVDDVIQIKRRRSSTQSATRSSMLTQQHSTHDDPD